MGRIPITPPARGGDALLVGTRKGAFIFKADSGRRRWRLAGPHFFGHIVHHMLLDPRDRKTLLVAARTGHLGPTVFRSTDFGRSWREAKRPPAFPKAKEGASWQPLNAGCRADFLPDPFPEYGHDPHCVRLHPLAPDRLYQQNHCGIYRMDRAEGRWVRIGENMPKAVGDIGFPLVLHPRDPDVLWVFPMDGTSVWPRTSPGGKPAVYATRDAGKSWRRLDRGLPRAQAWWTVKRQALSADGHNPVGIYFGTTSGELWASADEGKRFGCIARNLPHIYSVEAAELRR